MKRYIFAMQFTIAIIMFFLIGLNATVFAECGGPEWINTGAQGPHSRAYKWHYNKNETIGSTGDAKKICANFFRKTRNCYKKIPGVYGAFKYKNCQYSTGIYSITAINLETKEETSTQCMNC